MKCWNCGVVPMPPFETLGKGWHKCTVCGATYIKIPKPGHYPMTIKPDPEHGRSSSPVRQRQSKKKVKK